MDKNRAENTTAVSLLPKDQDFSYLVSMVNYQLKWKGRTDFLYIHAIAILLLRGQPKATTRIESQLI